MNYSTPLNGYSAPEHETQGRPCPSSLSSLRPVPFVTYFVGNTFDTFAFLTACSKPDARCQLRSVGIAAASLMLASTISLLWMRVGKMNVVALRRWVFRAVTNKWMEEFDRNVSREDDISAGSAKFSLLNIQISKPFVFFFLFGKRLCLLQRSSFSPLFHCSSPFYRTFRH